MGKLTIGQDSFEYLWVSDVEFDGIRLEIHDLAGEHWFDVSVPEEGMMTVNTFSREVPAALIAAAVELAHHRQ